MMTEPLFCGCLLTRFLKLGVPVCTVIKGQVQSSDLDGGTGYGYASIMSHDSWSRDYARHISIRFLIDRIVCRKLP